MEGLAFIWLIFLSWLVNLSRYLPWYAPSTLQILKNTHMPTLLSRKIIYMHAPPLKKISTYYWKGNNGVLLYYLKKSSAVFGWVEEGGGVGRWGGGVGWGAGKAAQGSSLHIMYRMWSLYMETQMVSIAHGGRGKHTRGKENNLLVLLQSTGSRRRV